MRPQHIINCRHLLCRWNFSLLPARLAYAALAIDFITCLWFLYRLALWSTDLATSPILSSAPCSRWAFPNPVHSIALLACLLGRATSAILWAGVILKEVLLAYIFNSEFAALGASRSLARSRLTYFIVMLYWMEGWVTFFQQASFCFHLLLRQLKSTSESFQERKTLKVLQKIKKTSLRHRNFSPI